MTRYICKNCNTNITQQEYQQNKCQKCSIKGARYFKMIVKDDNVSE